MKLILAGDSIMCAWPQIKYRYPQQGWGEEFKVLFDDTKIEVRNEAVSGWTAESFYENKWSKGLKENLTAGDYLIISYLHNDYCTSIDTSKSAYDPQYITTYTQYLERIIDECKGMDVNLIFVQPPNKGVQYDFHNNTADQQFGNFTAVMPRLAQENNIPFVNVHQWTLDLLTASDDSFEQTLKEIYLYKLVEQGIITEEERANHYNAGIKTNGVDTTHISVNGCKRIANYVAQQLEEVAPDLAAYLKK